MKRNLRASNNGLLPLRAGGVVGAALILLCVAQFTSPAWGWGAAVHRAVTRLALDGLPADGPAWLRDPAVRERAAFQSNQPDRWRGWKSDVLKHVNDPDHYLDVDLLGEFGLTLETVPRLRREYLRALVVAKHERPDAVSPYDAAQDPARSKEWPGFALHAVAEEYARLQAAFQQVLILEKLNAPQRRLQLEQARHVAIYHLGNLSHFVADLAQPLHTTRHYDGWVGENPANYRWRQRFHAYIDEGVARHHRLGYAALRPLVQYDARVNPTDPWEDVLAFVRCSHALVPKLYELERDGLLDGPEGRQFIAQRLTAAAALLAALINAAYESAAPTDAQIESWTRYDAFDAQELPVETAPATQPSP